MADLNQLERFMSPWEDWVQQRRSVWSHIHLSGLLLGEGDRWICVSMAIVLADASGCQSPKGVNPLWTGEVCAFRVAIPMSDLDELVDGLARGEWASNFVPGVPGKILFHPIGGKGLEPAGAPRLDAPNRGNDVHQNELLWPRFSVELTGHTLVEWRGQDRFGEIETLDKRLTGKGKPGLTALAKLFGVFDGSDRYVGDIWNRSTTVRLIAPVPCRISSAFWSQERSRFMALVDVGSLVPRDRVSVLLYDPQTLGLLEPVPISEDSGAPIEVDLGENKPSSRMEVRLLFFDEVVQTDHGVPEIGRATDFVGRLRPGTIGDSRHSNGTKGWTKIRSLAAGGQADVFLAKRDDQTGVLKEIRGDRSDPVRKERLRREINLLRRLKDLPSLIELIDSSAEDDEVPFLVTVLATLGSAEDRKISFKGDVWRVLRLARDLALALQGLHGQEVIHRDVKPKNIFLSSLDQGVLGDLGVAFDAGKTSLTTVVEPVESGWFSPPEHQRPGRPGPAYDTFMLGRTIYYLLTGGDKYRDDNFAQPDWSVARFIGQTAATPVNSLLAQLVAPEPKDRLSSMDLVISSIDTALRETFGRNGGEGRCSFCGKANYADAVPLNLSGAHLFLNLPDSRQLHLGKGNITIRVCPRCGTCAFQIDDEASRTLAASLHVRA